MAGMGGIQPALGGGEVLPCLGTAWHPDGPEAVRKAWLAAPRCRTSGPRHVSQCLRSPEKQMMGELNKGHCLAEWIPRPAGQGLRAEARWQPPACTP